MSSGCLLWSLGGADRDSGARWGSGGGGVWCLDDTPRRAGAGRAGPARAVQSFGAPPSIQALMACCWQSGMSPPAGGMGPVAPMLVRRM